MLTAKPAFDGRPSYSISSTSSWTDAMVQCAFYGKAKGKEANTGQSCACSREIGETEDWQRRAQVQEEILCRTRHDRQPRNQVSDISKKSGAERWTSCLSLQPDNCRSPTARVIPPNFGLCNCPTPTRKSRRVSYNKISSTSIHSLQLWYRPQHGQLEPAFALAAAARRSCSWMSLNILSA